MTQITRTREIGAPPAPLPARGVARPEPSFPKTDRTDGRTDAICPMDNSIQKMVAELASHLRAGNVSNGQIQNVSNGQIYVFRVTRPDIPDRATRFERCVEWMKRNQITHRATFFEGCPEANGSASLHHRCIMALKREGLIEKIGREYVFKDGE